MLTAHKIALAPNNVQATYFARAAGTARFAYNWALAEWQRQYEAFKADESLPRPSEAALRRKLNSIKREEFPWMMEVTKNAPQMAIMQLGTAFRNFFNKRAQYPQFRRKGIHDRFTLTNDQFRIEGAGIRIPGLGWVKMCEGLRFDGKIMNATISREADRWFAAIAVEMPNEIPYTPEGSPIALDVGLTTFAANSDGMKLTAPKPLANNLLKLKKLQRQCTRKVETQKKRMGLTGKAIPKGVRLPVSNNLKKSRRKVAKLHRRIGDIRKDFLHKTSTELAKTKPVIVVEDLHVKGMVRNPKLARHIADASWSEFRRQLDYKCRKFGSSLCGGTPFLCQFQAVLLL